MKKSLILSFGLISASIIPVAINAANPLTNYKFAESSPLASGKWVKISIDETGMYEITYDQLKEMGFDDPSKVSVFGTGGTQLDYSFISSKNNSRLIEDNLVPTHILHYGKKILFYGSGTETISASTTGYSSFKRFKHERKTKNIYSDRSYYMLTDSQPVTTVEAHPVSSKEGASLVENGYAYIYHEKDLRQGRYNVGQTFWGEELLSGQSLSYDIDMPYCVDKPAYVCSDFACMENQPGSYSINLNGGIASISLNNSTAKIFNLYNDRQDARLTIGENGRGTGKLSFMLSGNYDKYVPFAVDYWILTYPIDLGLAVDDPDFVSHYIAIESGKGNLWRHPAPKGCMVWDITSRNNPKALDVEDSYFYNDNDKTSEMIVFNPDRTQKHINEDWTYVENQNLHALQNEPVDMIIFTVSHLREYADQIAELHARYDGTRVAVVTPEEVFNEFNHGTPDATAYRIITKMLYQNESHRLKNVLFLGNIYKDYRNVNGISGRSEGHIGYMLPMSKLQLPKGAEGACAMEYYGSVSDFFNQTGSTISVPISVGVGLLPINSKEEAAIAVAKIRNYLEKEDFSNVVNEMLGISGTGDSHIHDLQSFNLREIYQKAASDNLDSEFAVGQLWSEGLSDDHARVKMLESLKNGKLISTYYGHASSTGFGSIKSSDFMNLDCKDPGFLFIAACDLSEPDNQQKGIGDLSVTGSTKGFAGVISATRTVYSHENQALSENFANAMFYDSDKKFRTSTPTIGEVFAQAKEKTVNSSKPAYILVGDPALIMPVALGKINVSTDRTDYRAGEIIEVKGAVLDSNGETDKTYNGFATIKVMEPKQTIKAVPDGIDKDNNPIIYAPLVINDNRMATVKVIVKNGEFTGRLTLPDYADNFLSTPDSPNDISILVGAYNPTTRFGTSGRATARMAMRGSEPSGDVLRDESAPTVSASHDNLMRRLSVTATDETALLPGIGRGGAVTLTIDGKSYSLKSNQSDNIGVTHYEASINTADLAPGTHKAVISAVDMAGNRSDSQTVSFEIKNLDPLKLKISDDMVIDKLDLSIDRNDGLTLALIVSDRNGNIVLTEDFNGSAGNYDIADLPAGTYRAAVRDNSPKGAIIYSNWVEFTKID